MRDGIDPITGLPARDAFLTLLQREVNRCNESRTRLALLVVDVNAFTQINVAHGYAVGDQVLEHVAQQVRNVTRRHDHAGRIGDNRFALLLTDMLNQGHVALAAQKLQRLLETPYQHEDVQIGVSVTAGAALCPDHASHAEFLLRKAETALVSARREMDSYQLASGATSRFDLSAQWQLEMALERALDRDELELHYQPQVRATDHSVVGAEALMRWHSHDHGLIMPEVFIPIAERSGQLRSLTLWALNTALRQAREWRADLGPLTVSVNIPSAMTARRDLPELVENALKLWGCEHVNLTLEITERSLMNREHSSRILSRIRELGTGVSIDDFGTGYSCLAYFKDIPADELKIDRSFVHDMVDDRASTDITNVIIELAHRFDLKVVGEGVENQAIMEMLEARQCDILQGYLFGMPMPEAAFLEWLAQQSPSAVSR